MFLLFDQMRLWLGDVMNPTAVHMLLQLPQIWKSTGLRSGLLVARVGAMKSGVYKETDTQFHTSYRQDRYPVSKCHLQTSDCTN